MSAVTWIQIPLSGVSSVNDSRMLEKEIMTVEGVEDGKVDFNNQRLMIQSSRKQEQLLPDIVRKIRSLGYEVPEVKRSFPVLDMSCASCAVNVEESLKTHPGMLEAGVNFATATAEVQYIEGMTEATALQAAVRSAGYDLVIEDREDLGDSLEKMKVDRYQALKRRVIGALIFAIPLFLIGMFMMDMPYADYLMWALSTPLLFYFGWPFFSGAWKQARHGSANMDTLVAMSTGVAYGFSVFNTLNPHFWHQRGIHAHVYFEAAGIVIAFILLGRLLEERAKGNTRSALKKLMGLQPSRVMVIRSSGVQEEMAVQEVKEGDRVLVRPGERIAVDGKVVDGSSYVDESMISGEAIPVRKDPGQEVFAGTVNQKGSFSFIALQVGTQTVLAQIIRMVEQAQGSKAPVQKLVDKIAAVFVPVVMGIAVISFFTWWFLGGENGFNQGLMAFVTVLVIACPCALGLATPTAIMVGVGKGAEAGILIKDAESLEIAQRVNVFILDKTGTITEGKPTVTAMRWFTEKQSHWNNVLFSMERSSEHPLAEAIVHFLEGDAHWQEGLEINNITGQGISAGFRSAQYLIGNRGLMAQYSVEIPEEAQGWMAEQWRMARTVVFFSENQQLLAGIAIADQIKAGSKEAIERFHEAGIEVFMLTGDNEYTAQAVANAVGIDHFEANVLPAGKADFIRDLQEKGKVVAMVGDGINDSNALAQADVSIAMGRGSDIAMDVAKMTIISSNLSKIPEAIALSRQTVKAIRQNLFWAFIYNVIGIPVAAGLLYPLNGFLLDPMWAGAAMAMSSVSVVANSLRLKWT